MHNHNKLITTNQRIVTNKLIVSRFKILRKKFSILISKQRKMEKQNGISLSRSMPDIMDFNLKRSTAGSPARKTVPNVKRVSPLPSLLSAICSLS